MFWKKILYVFFVSHLLCSVTLADEPRTKARLQHKKLTHAMVKIEEKIDLNDASEAVLVEIPGINSAKAKAIINYRKEKGSFSSLDELAKVKGFKRLNAEKRHDLEKYLVVNARHD